MDRLLQLVMPDKLFMGQKDYQQCLVLKKLTEAKYPSVQLIICPTQRESDGLAMSSRNVRLSMEGRLQAVKIYQALQFIKATITAGGLSSLKLTATKQLTDQSFKVDYVEIAAANSLQLLESWDGKEPVVALVAAFLDGVRLIDNLLLN